MGAGRVGLALLLLLVLLCVMALHFALAFSTSSAVADSADNVPRFECQAYARAVPFQLHTSA